MHFFLPVRPLPAHMLRFLRNACFEFVQIQTSNSHKFNHRINFIFLLDSRTISYQKISIKSSTANRKINGVSKLFRKAKFHTEFGMSTTLTHIRQLFVSVCTFIASTIYVYRSLFRSFGSTTIIPFGVRCGFRRRRLCRMIDRHC